MVGPDVVGPDVDGPDVDGAAGLDTAAFGAAGGVGDRPAGDRWTGRTPALGAGECSTTCRCRVGPEPEPEPPAAGAAVGTVNGAARSAIIASAEVLSPDADGTADARGTRSESRPTSVSAAGESGAPGTGPAAERATTSSSTAAGSGALDVAGVRVGAAVGAVPDGVGAALAGDSSPLDDDDVTGRKVAATEWPAASAGLTAGAVVVPRDDRCTGGDSWGAADRCTGTVSGAGSAAAAGLGTVAASSAPGVSWLGALTGSRAPRTVASPSPPPLVPELCSDDTVGATERATTRCSSALGGAGSEVPSALGSVPAATGPSTGAGVGRSVGDETSGRSVAICRWTAGAAGAAGRSGTRSSSVPSYGIGPPTEEVRPPTTPPGPSGSTRWPKGARKLGFWCVVNDDRKADGGATAVPSATLRCSGGSRVHAAGTPETDGATSAVDGVAEPGCGRSVSPAAAAGASAPRPRPQGNRSQGHRMVDTPLDRSMPAAQSPEMRVLRAPTSRTNR